MREPMILRLQGKEREAVAIRRATHACNPDARPTVDHSDVSCTFTPGGLGTTIVVRCHLCGQPADCADDDCW